MFKVRAIVVAFLGNEELYPCHMGHKVGDEVIFDGESYSGRLCPDVWPLIATKVSALHQAGPRYVEWASYYPFWYCPPSFADPSKKKYDGLGYRCNLNTIIPPPHDMANLVPPDSFRWPPHDTRDILTTATVTCPDGRTSMVVKLEAFDLSEKGFDTPFFRRQMAMLLKLQTKGDLQADGILATFTKSQIEDIYPPLSAILAQMLLEELILMGYVAIQDGTASITAKGNDKLRDFQSHLPDDDREVFARYQQ